MALFLTTKHCTKMTERQKNAYNIHQGPCRRALVCRQEMPMVAHGFHWSLGESSAAPDGSLPPTVRIKVASCIEVLSPGQLWSLPSFPSKARKKSLFNYKKKKKQYFSLAKNPNSMQNNKALETEDGFQCLHTDTYKTTMLCSLCFVNPEGLIFFR